MLLSVCQFNSSYTVIDISLIGAGAGAGAWTGAGAGKTDMGAKDFSSFPHPSNLILQGLVLGEANHPMEISWAYNTKGVSY